MSVPELNKNSHRSAEWKVRRNKVLTIMVAWLVIGVMITLYDHLLFNSRFSGSVNLQYTFLGSLVLNSFVAITASLLGGSFLVFIVNEKYRNAPYWKSIALVAASFIIVSTSLVIIVSFGVSYLSTAFTYTESMEFLTDTGHLKNAIVWLAVLILTHITIQVNDKFGQGVLWNLIRGKYHIPREETRIFMFVDLMSSTAIAETLGNKKYHLLLRDFFEDITDAILYNKGEIYQYVGDEIVLSWPLSGKGFNNQCLQCFFDMRKSISRQSGKYLQRYGIVPDFKSGLHYGKVIAGEIGIIKREITYSGDVLNTTSRIQSKCNEYSVKILTSDELLYLLPYGNHFNRISIGDIELKGKENRMSLSTLEMKI